MGIRKIENEIASLTTRLENARVRLEKIKNESPDHVLASELHEAFCHFSHVDACGWQWEYGESVWEGFTHKRWLAYARKIRARFPELSNDELFELVKLFRYTP